MGAILDTLRLDWAKVLWRFTQGRRISQWQSCLPITLLPADRADSLASSTFSVDFLSIRACFPSLMGKNQAYKAMQRARLGSSSAGPEEVEDGMVCTFSYQTLRCLKFRFCWRIFYVYVAVERLSLLVVGIDSDLNVKWIFVFSGPSGLCSSCYFLASLFYLNLCCCKVVIWLVLLVR